MRGGNTQKWPAGISGQIHYVCSMPTWEFSTLVPKKKIIGIFTGFFFSFSVSFCGGSKTDHSGIVKMVLEKRF